MERNELLSTVIFSKNNYPKKNKKGVIKNSFYIIFIIFCGIYKGDMFKYMIYLILIVFDGCTTGEFLYKTIGFLNG